jgi:hypothetical protein
MLTIAGGVSDSLIRFCNAMNPPKLLVSAHEASSIAALGAAALAHSTSMAASPSSLLTPGSVQVPAPPMPKVPGTGWTCVKEPAGYALARPNVDRNLFQSPG